MCKAAFFFFFSDWGQSHRLADTYVLFFLTQNYLWSMPRVNFNSLFGEDGGFKGKFSLAKCMSWLEQSDDENTQDQRRGRAASNYWSWVLWEEASWHDLDWEQTVFQLASQGKKKEIISLLFGGLSQLWKGNLSLWWFWKSFHWKIPIDFWYLTYSGALRVVWREQSLSFPGAWEEFSGKWHWKKGCLGFAQMALKQALAFHVTWAHYQSKKRKLGCWQRASQKSLQGWKPKEV